MKPGWILDTVLGLFREAKLKLSLEERMSRIETALRERFAPKNSDGSCGYGVYPIQTFDDAVTYRANGKTFSIDYSFDEAGAVSLGSAPTEVVQRWVPIKREAFADLREAGLDARGAAEVGAGLIRIESLVLGPALEAGASEPTGRVWDVVLVREGMSKNRNHYGRKALAEAVALYEGRPMFPGHSIEAGPFGRPNAEEKVVGFTSGIRGVVLTEEAVDATGAGTGKAGANYFGLFARAGLVEDTFARKLLAAHALGHPNAFGLSHDVRAESVTATNDGGPFYEVSKITRVESTDWVLNPAAGGRVVRLVASDTPNPQLQEDVRMLQHLLESLKKAGIPVPDGCDEATATRLLNEALARIPKPETAEDKAAREAREAADQVAATACAVTVDRYRLMTEAERTAARTAEAARLAAVPAPTADQNRISLLEASLLASNRNMATVLLDRSLLECALPDPFKKRIRKHFEAQIKAGTFPTVETIAARIGEFVEDVGALAEANVIMPHSGTPHFQITRDSREQLETQLDEFFGMKREGKNADGSPKLTVVTNMPMFSFKEAYVRITGDEKVSGKMSEAVRRRLSESMTTSSFDQILGDSITRRMLKDYAVSTLATWRGTVAEVVPLSDFRTVRRLRFGGYGNLDTVSQGAPYVGMTSPTDEEATYAPAKRGGTEQITLEMIRNDDVGAIRRIPAKLARAAAQTLHEFVWDFLANNSTVYDSVALAASGHANIVTTALSDANLSSLRLKMKQQADMSNSKRLGLIARYVISPSELEQQIFELITSDKKADTANNNSNFQRKQNYEHIVVEYWTDTNNYWMAASVDQTPMLEIGFLDGQESPELFVQDIPAVGSMFSNDALTWKLRHIYGGGVMDYRGFAAGIVA